MAEYLQFRGVSSDLKRRVRRHFGTCWKRSPLPYEEAAILADLSAPLRAEVARRVDYELLLLLVVVVYIIIILLLFS